MVLKKQILEQEKDFELKKVNQTGSERKLIVAQYLSDIANLERETGKQRTDIIDQEGQKQADAENEALEKRRADKEKADAEYLAAEQKRLDLEQTLFQISIEKKNDLRQNALNLTQQITDGIFQLDRDSYNKDAQATQELFDKKLITEQEYNKRQEALNRERLNAEKKKALLDIAIDFSKSLFQIQSQAAIQGAAPPPLGELLRARVLAGIPFVVGQFLASSAFIAARKYKQGEIDIEGPGTTTSDSIPAWLSKGESIIDAEQTAQHKLALIAIQENKFKEYLDKYERPKFYERYQLPLISEADERRMTVNNNTSVQIDYEKLGKVIAQEMADHPVLNLNIDNDGFNASVQKGLDTINYKNRKLNM